MKNKKTIGEASQPVIVLKSGNNLIGYVLAAASLATGGFFLNKYFKDRAANSETEKVGTEADATAASEITTAANPSGFTWLSRVDGSNATTIMKAMETAIKGGKTYKQISDSYKKITKGGILENDMKKELSVSQYQSFLNVAKLNTKSDYANTANFKNPVKVGDVLSSIASVTVRKTPYINGSTNIVDRRGNAIELIKDAGTFIGIASGKYKTTTSRDTITADKASTTTVFYEVLVSDNAYKTYNVWVAAGLIKVYPKGTKPSTFKKMYQISVSDYNKAQAINAPYLEGLGELSKLI